MIHRICDRFFAVPDADDKLAEIVDAFKAAGVAEKLAIERTMDYMLDLDKGDN